MAWQTFRAHICLSLSLSLPRMLCKSDSCRGVGEKRCGLLVWHTCWDQKTEVNNMSVQPQSVTGKTTFLFSRCFLWVKSRKCASFFHFSKSKYLNIRHSFRARFVKLNSWHTFADVLETPSETCDILNSLYFTPQLIWLEQFFLRNVYLLSFYLQHIGSKEFQTLFSCLTVT